MRGDSWMSFAPPAVTRCKNTESPRAARRWITRWRRSQSSTALNRFVDVSSLEKKGNAMNEKGREALVQAALDGVEQLRGMYRRGNAVCAMGALHRAFNVQCDSDLYSLGVLKRGVHVCPECGVRRSREGSLITHLNDDHEFDFL